MLEINNHCLGLDNDLAKVVQSFRMTQKVVLKVLRGQETKIIQLILGSQI